MPVILRISKLYKRIFSFTKSGLINEINVLADAELVNNLEQLAAAASVTPTPEPPDGNPLLEAAGISYNHTEVSDTDTSTTNAIAVNLPYGPAPLTKNKTSAKIIQMPQRKII